MSNVSWFHAYRGEDAPPDIVTLALKDNKWQVRLNNGIPLGQTDKRDRAEGMFEAAREMALKSYGASEIHWAEKPSWLGKEEEDW